MQEWNTDLEEKKNRFLYMERLFGGFFISSFFF